MDTYAGEPTLCGYTPRQLLDLERAAREATAALAEIVTLTEGATYESKYATFGEIKRQANLVRKALGEALVT